jgi:hypothetical protein
MPTLNNKDLWKTYKISDEWVYETGINHEYIKPKDTHDVLKQIEEYLKKQEKNNSNTTQTTINKPPAPKIETRDEMSVSPDCGPALAEMINGL